MITKADVHSWNPCPETTDEFIDDCFAGRETLDYDALMNIPELKDDWLLWTILRPEVIKDATLKQIRKAYLKLIEDRDIRYSEWKDLSTVDLIGKVVRAMNQPPEQTYAMMLDIVREHNG